MTYEYKCPQCDTLQDIDKPMSEAGRSEFCPTCKQILTRVYSGTFKTLGYGWSKDNYNSNK